MSYSGDRRSHPRDEVVGALWGQIELHEPVQVRNVSTDGALIESPVPCAVDSEQVVRVMVEGEAVHVDARVRSVQPLDGARRRYAIGLEFVAPPLSVLQHIEQLEREQP